MLDLKSLRKQWNRHFTLMIVPHSDVRSYQFHLSFKVIAYAAMVWTGLTIWSGFIASRHVNYWRAKANEQMLKTKVWYFSQEIKRSREYIDQVRETEVALRNLLNMKDRKVIIRSNVAVGGPTRTDETQLKRLLSGVNPIPVDEMASSIHSMHREGADVLAGFEEISSYIKEQQDLFAATPVGWPSEGRVTSNFGRRVSPLDDFDHEFHRGIDIANMLGTPVKATAAGVVKIASWQGGYGRLVIIEHDRGFQTYYAHNSQILVQPGDHVDRGQVISYMGTSGHSTGYHLHYEVWQNGKAVNPIRFIKET